VCCEIEYIAGSPAKFNAQTFTLTGVDGEGSQGTFQGLTVIALTPDDSTIIVTDAQDKKIRQVNIVTRQVTTIKTMVDGGHRLAITPDGLTLVITDDVATVIREVDRTTGTSSILAGSTLGYKDGVGTEAQFAFPRSVLVTPDGLTVIVTHNFVYFLSGILRGRYKHSA
jgi:hypothetical protein